MHFNKLRNNINGEKNIVLLIKHLHYNCWGIYKAVKFYKLSSCDLQLQECSLIDFPFPFRGDELGTSLNTFSHHEDGGYV